MPPKKRSDLLITRLFSKSDLNPGWPIMACAQLKQTGMILAIKQRLNNLFNLMRGARPHKAAMAMPRITINPIISVRLTPDALIVWFNIFCE